MSTFRPTVRPLFAHVGTVTLFPVVPSLSSRSRVPPWPTYFTGAPPARAATILALHPPPPPPAAQEMERAEVEHQGALKQLADAHTETLREEKASAMQKAIAMLRATERDLFTENKRSVVNGAETGGGAGRCERSQWRRSCIEPPHYGQVVRKRSTRSARSTEQ